MLNVFMETPHIVYITCLKRPYVKHFIQDLEAEVLYMEIKMEMFGTFAALKATF